MESEPDLNEVVATYIEVIKQDSLEAAAAIKEIQITCGARAALRSTLVLTLTKIDYLENQTVQNVSDHRYLIREFPEAAPMLERALSSCLQARETARIALANQANGNHNGEDASLPSELPPDSP